MQKHHAPNVKDVIVICLFVLLILFVLIRILIPSETASEPVVQQPEETVEVPTPEPTAPEPQRWDCADPRPTRCPTTTDVVCGSDAAEYRNDCYACRDTGVAWYTEGPCAPTS